MAECGAGPGRSPSSAKRAIEGSSAIPEEDYPRNFGKYRLTGLLGAGGMAEVYRAEPLQPTATGPKQVAIKRILNGHIDPELDTMLLDEARIWRRLNHPNIVQLLEFGEHEDDWFLALELVDGLPLSELLKSVDVLPPNEALCIAERVARALDHAHTRKDDAGRALDIVHRDVKPANILISTRGEVKLTDFGIARAVDRLSRTQIGVIKGSVYFLSPEQANGGKIDGRSDLFSLGAVLHVMLTGTALIDMEADDEILDALTNGRIPPPPPNLPPAVRDVLSSITAFDPDERPANGEELARRIRIVLEPSKPEDVERLLAARVRAAIAGNVLQDDPDRTTLGIPAAASAASALTPRSGAAAALTPRASSAASLTPRPSTAVPLGDDKPTTRSEDPWADEPSLDDRTVISPRAQQKLAPIGALGGSMSARTAGAEPSVTMPRRVNPDRGETVAVPAARRPAREAAPASPDRSLSRPSRPSEPYVERTAPRPQASSDTAPDKRAPISLPGGLGLVSWVVLALLAIILGAVAMLVAGPLYDLLAG